MNDICLNLNYVMLAYRHIELNPSQKESYFAVLIMTDESPQEISMHWLRSEYIQQDIVDISN